MTTQAKQVKKIEKHMADFPFPPFQFSAPKPEVPEWDKHELCINPAPGTCCPEMKKEVICEGCGHNYGLFNSALRSELKGLERAVAGMKEKKAIQHTMMVLNGIDLESWAYGYREAFDDVLSIIRRKL